MRQIKSISGMRSAVATPLAVLLLAGCYGYYPTTAPPAVSDGRRVLVALNDSGMFLLAPKLGPYGVGVEGTLAERPDTAYVLSVLVVHRFNGSDENWKGERLVVPRRLTTSLTERHFSPGRTALFSAGLAVALSSIKAAFQGNGSSHGGGTGAIVAGK